MSKAFTREDDVRDEPLVRPDVLAGEPRYITPAGAERLRRALAAARAANDPADALQRVVDQLVVVDPASQPRDVVVFGTTVTVRDADDRERTLRLVGVDEVAEGHVSWRSPLGRALMGARVGDSVTVETPRGEDELEVVALG